MTNWPNGGGMPYDPSQPVPIMVEFQINGVWIDVTTRGRAAGDVHIKHGMSDGAIQPESSTCQLTVGNDDAWLTEGDPRSPWHPYIGRGTPMRVSLRGMGSGGSDARRFSGEIDEMVAIYPGGPSSSMRIDATGAWSVIAQNEDPVRPPLRRAILEGPLTPVAYWPLDGGSASGQGESGLAGGPPMIGFGAAAPRFAVHNDHVGSAPLPDFSSKGGLQASVPAYTDTGQWQVVLWFRTLEGPSTGFTASVPAQWDLVGGTIPAFDILMFVGEGAGGQGVGTIAFTISAYEASPPNESNRSTSLDIFVQGIPNTQGTWRELRVTAEQITGTDVEMNAYLDGVLLGTATDAPWTLGQPQNVVLNPTQDTPGANAYAGVDGIGISSLGHAVIYDSVDDPQTYSAGRGYPGQSETERVNQLAADGDVTITVTGGSTIALGPRRQVPFATLLTDAQQAGMSLISDSLDDPTAIVYRTQSHLYTQAARVAIHTGALMPDIAPTWNNQRIGNDWTVSRVDGGTAQASDEDHVTRTRRRHRKSATINVSTDDVLPSHARWRAHLGTAPGPRYPSFGINLRNLDGARLADAVLALTPGDRLTAADSALPDQHPRGGVDQMVLGWEELLDVDMWEFYPNCVPYKPYQQVGRWALLSHELRVAINSTVTSVDIVNTDTSQPMLATDAADIGSGYAVVVGTDQMYLTAVAASLPSFGAAGTASTGSSGSRTPALPGSSAAGNLVVIFASTRNSGTGVPDTPADWDHWPIFPATANCQVFARVYDGVWSMPTVTFTGGSANEDTVAQSFRLPGKWHAASKVLIGSASCLNTSAQNVTYPGLPKPVADNSIILYFAWKQDDISAAASPGTEIQEASTTAGNDASQVCAYAVQTAAASVASGVFTMTGGGAAISRGAIAAVRCDYQTATVVRGVNSTSAASHAAGDDVVLADPMRWGL